MSRPEMPSGFYVKTPNGADMRGPDGYNYTPVEGLSKVVFVTGDGDEMTFTGSPVGHVKVQLSQRDAADWLVAMNASVNVLYLATFDEEENQS